MKDLEKFYYKSRIKQILIDNGRIGKRNKLKHAVLPLSNRHLRNAVVLASRDDALDSIPKYGVCVEVGVAYRDFSETILKKLQPKKFHALDIFQMTYENQIWGLERLKPTDTHETFYARRFSSEIDTGIMELNKGPSSETISKFPDKYFDYAYIDAMHQYDAVKKDIELIFPKMKPGSYIQFNDYTLWNYMQNIEYGVVQAVNEFLIENDFGITAFCIAPNGFHDILVKLDKLEA